MSRGGLLVEQRTPSNNTSPWGGSKSQVVLGGMFFGAYQAIQDTTTLHSCCFEVELNASHKGESIESEDRVNRRRTLAGIVSVVLLGLVALLLPSLHKTAEPAAPTMQPLVEPPAETAATRAESEPPSILAPVVEAKEAPLPPAPQSALPDVDPHKAFGSRSAPVTMEVFSDYQCPACKTLFTTTNRRLMDDYVSNGRVYLIHRDFPLPMHAHSRVAARYARAAAQIGKVEAVEQALFQNQEKWEQNGDVDGTVAAVLSPAEMARVRALVKGGTLDPMIDKDYALGQTYRVNQTPTTVFHCKGQTYPYSGVMTYEILKQFLDQLLSQK
jgi:protein-disulfide isomerase